MISVPLTVRFFVATGTAAVLVGCSSGGEGSDAPEAHEPAATTTATSASPIPTEDAAKRAYLDSVNGLCDALLPKVVKATHGGSTDVPATEWAETWPAHESLLDGFDADLAAVSVPPSAAASAQVIAAYVVWATGIDEARIAAARQGEEAWQGEITAERGIENAPELLALSPAGFSDSCQAR
jgi:hypothetical protein